MRSKKTSLAVFADDHTLSTEAGHFHSRCRRSSCCGWLWLITAISVCSGISWPNPASYHSTAGGLARWVWLLGRAQSPVLPSPQAPHHFCWATVVWGVLIIRIGFWFGKSVGATVWDYWVFQLQHRAWLLFWGEMSRVEEGVSAVRVRGCLWLGFIRMCLANAFDVALLQEHLKIAEMETIPDVT